MARKARPLRNLFLLDVLGDPDSRPVFIYGLSTLLLGAFVFQWLEGWEFLDAFYFCVISLTTVGYGDFTPTTPAGKIFTMVYILNGIVILLSLFDRIRAVRKQHFDDEARKQVEG